MNIDDLVERITREVLASLERSTSAASPPSATKPPVLGGVRILLVFSGEVSELRCLLDEPQAALSPAQVTLLLGRDSSVRRSKAEEMGFARVLYMDEGQHPSSLMAGIERVLVPVYRYQQLSNLAGLCDSCWDVRVVLRALAEGRPVRLLLGALENASAFQAKVEAYRKEIASYGIEVVVATGAAPARPGAPGAAPPPPHTSARSAHGHVGHGACQLKAVGECGGLGHCSQHLPERVGIILEHGADRLSAAPGGAPVGAEMARYIDHTLLKADATREEVLKLCEEARQHQFASVCVNPGFVRLAADALAGSTVKVCTVVGFPLGATTTVSKALETRDAVANGADEIDMVINVGALKARNDDLVRRDIEAVVEAAAGRIVKVILETALLNDEEKVRASRICQEAGADFVKTSTGFGPGGATAHDIALMRQTVGRYMGVKASGGIRDLAVAQEMMKAGATRIGASASVKIVKGEQSDPAKGKQAY